MNELNCENFLVECDPNQAGFRQWRNFLRQWYLHGPLVMSSDVRAAAEGGRWDEVLDAEAVPDESRLRPDVKPVTDPRDMVDKGAWMRWETMLGRTFWRYPEKVITCLMLHEWYVPRTPEYPQWTLPPEHIHLPLSHYTEDDVLAPYWVHERDAPPRGHCPRCDAAADRELKPAHCPGCGQRLGGYDTYSARGWPRKAPYANRPPLPDEFSFYFLAAWVHVPPGMGQLDLWVGSDCRYRLWVNGEEAGRYTGLSRFPQWDSDRHTDVALHEGWNLLLAKLAHQTQGTDMCTFMARVAGTDGRLTMVDGFAKENIAPERTLRITVADEVAIGLGHQTPNLRRFPDGTLVCTAFVSRDQGASWTTCPCVMPRQMDESWPESRPADVAAWGTRQEPATLILAEKCTEVEPGVYRGRLCRSLDGWKTREVAHVTIRIPDGTNLVDEANQETGPGCIMGLNIVCLPNGDLLVPMYASLRQDVVWFDLRTFGGFLKYPQQWPRQFKYRSWLLRSTDGGLHWDYLSTIAAFPELGDEGPCEPNIELLPDGTLLAVLRNGGGDTGPLWISSSDDGGETWSCPVRTILTGNYPSLVYLSNGVLACTYGRPNKRVSFDLTGTGLAWSHTVVLSNCRGNDHVEACETAPGELFCVWEGDEYDGDGRRLGPHAGLQYYGARVRTQRLDAPRG